MSRTFPPVEAYVHHDESQKLHWSGQKPPEKQRNREHEEFVQPDYYINVRLIWEIKTSKTLQSQRR